jgi:hypothetical protein
MDGNIFTGSKVKGDSEGMVNILGGDSIRHFEEKTSYEHVSSSEWLPRYSCWNLTLDFCFWGSMNSEVYKRNVDPPDELLARILDATACTKKREDQLRRTTRDLRTRAAECTVLTLGFSNIYCYL